MAVFFYAFRRRPKVWGTAVALIVLYALGATYAAFLAGTERSYDVEVHECNEKTVTGWIGTDRKRERLITLSFPKFGRASFGDPAEVATIDPTGQQNEMTARSICEVMAKLKEPFVNFETNGLKRIERVWFLDSLEDVSGEYTKFKDPAGRFSITYPSSWQQVSAEEPYHSLADNIVTVFTNEAEYHPINYVQDSWVAVSASAMDEESCYADLFDGLVPFNHEQLIDDRPFKVARRDDAGAGNSYEQTLYRRAMDGVCYEIATTLHTASDWTDVDLEAIEQSQASARLELEQIVEMFRF